MGYRPFFLQSKTVMRAATVPRFSGSISSAGAESR